MTGNLPIIDLDFGIEQLSGNKQLFVELLCRFRDQYQGSYAHIMALKAERQDEEARIHAHTVKGVCANLGLLLLNNASRQLEQAFKQGSSATSCLNHYDQALKATLEEIKRLETQQIDEHQGNDSALETLKTMLDNNQFIAPDTLTELLAELNLNDDTRKKLLKAIDDLEYPEALTLLQQLTP